MKRNSLFEKQKAHKEQQDAMRKNLKEKFVSNMKKSSTDSQPVAVSVTTNNSEDPSVANVGLKKENKRLEKQLKKQEDQLADERKSHLRTKRKLEEKGQKLFEAEKLKELAIQEKSEMESKMEELKQQIQGYKAEISELEIKLDKAISAQLPESDITNEERLQFMNTIMQLERELDRDKSTIQKPNPIRSSSPSIGSMLQNLEQSLSIDTVQHYSAIHSIAEEVRKLMLFKKRPEWYHEVDPIIKKKVEQSMLFDFGYISQRNDQWVFCNLMNIPYRLQLNYVNAVEDAPAKVVMVEGIAYLKEVYVDDQAMHKEILESKVLTRKNQINKPINNMPSPYFGDFQVLFVGEYLDPTVTMTVERHGLSLETHDTSKLDLELLREQLRDANLVIVSKNQVPHAIYSIINKDDRKVEIMTNTHVDRMITRIRTASVRLGLMDRNTPSMQYHTHAG